MEVGGTAEKVAVLALASDIVIEADEDLSITATGGNFTFTYYIDEEFAIGNNNLLATISKWGENF